MITNVSDRELALQQALDDTRREVLAYSITVENLEQTVERLQGEATVMVNLLTEAVGVLQTIEPECATEAKSLTCLRGDIWAVLVAVAGRPA